MYSLELYDYTRYWLKSVGTPEDILLFFNGEENIFKGHSYEWRITLWVDGAILNCSYLNNDEGTLKELKEIIERNKNV